MEPQVGIAAAVIVVVVVEAVALGALPEAAQTCEVLAA